MASTSASRGSGAAARIKITASTLCSDNQCLLADIRRSLNLMKDVGVALEKEKQYESVKELEDCFVELVGASERYTDFSSALQSVGNAYQSKEELTDFKKLFEDEIAKLGRGSSSVPQNHPLPRQFKEALWNVHHAGKPMPGEEQEDIVMTHTETALLNAHCPLTGKPIAELSDPVRSMDCKHIYEKDAILNYMEAKQPNPRCPVAACPKVVQQERVVCDPLLGVEIEELRSMSKTWGTDIIEDFTALDEEESD